MCKDSPPVPAVSPALEKQTPRVFSPSPVLTCVASWTLSPGKGLKWAGSTGDAVVRRAHACVPGLCLWRPAAATTDDAGAGRVRGDGSPTESQDPRIEPAELVLRLLLVQGRTCPLRPHPGPGSLFPDFQSPVWLCSWPPSLLSFLGTRSCPPRCGLSSSLPDASFLLP